MPWYPEFYKLKDINYSLEDKEYIEGDVRELEKKNPDLGHNQVKILEVVHRYRGDAGLSNHAVAYLTSAILHVIDEIYTESDEKRISAL